MSLSPISRTGVRRTARHALITTLLLASLSAHAGGKFIFVSHAPDSNTWWNTIKNSLKQASEDFGVQVEYRNPKLGDIKDMARIIDEAAASKPDGMIVTIADYAVLKDHLMAVSQKYKIPLVTVNAGSYAQSEEVGAILHIGQPDLAAGKAAGVKARKDGVKSFVCFNNYSNNPPSHERCNGFAQGLGLTKADEVELTGDDKTMQGQAVAYLSAHPNVEAILTLGPQPAQAALSALKSVKMAKAPYIATFDLSSAITEGIKRGQIAFAIDQQPYLQGYLAVGLLAELKNGASPQDLQMTKFALYANKKLLARMAKYDITLLTFGNRHIDSGPGFVSKGNVAKVETYSGTYR